MNLGRSKDSGDAAEDRNAGSYQKDAFQEHTHDLQYFSGVHWDFRSNDYAGAVKPMADGSLITGKPTLTAGGEETRPRNLAFYIYIKVN